MLSPQLHAPVTLYSHTQCVCERERERERDTHTHTQHNTHHTWAREDAKLRLACVHALQIKTSHTQLNKEPSIYAASVWKPESEIFDMWDIKDTSNTGGGWMLLQFAYRFRQSWLWEFRPRDLLARPVQSWTWTALGEHRAGASTASWQCWRLIPGSKEPQIPATLDKRMSQPFTELSAVLWLQGYRGKLLVWPSWIR